MGDLYLFYLQEIEFDGCGSAEDGDQYTQGIAIAVDLVHLARKIREWSVDDANGLVLFERELRTRALGGGRLPVQNLVDLVGAEGHRVVAASDETGDARRILHLVPKLVVHLDL